jgi:hypothetical protein
MTTKLTKAQQKVMDELMRYYTEAQEDFETWYVNSHFTNTYEKPYSSFEEAVNDHYLWIAKRDQPNDVDGYIADMLAFCRKWYEAYRSGTFQTHQNSSTLRALEKKGYIEIIVDGMNHDDTIRLLNI